MTAEHIETTPVGSLLQTLVDLIPAWMTEALCAQIDPDQWFPEKGGSTRDVKEVCASCPVKAECLQYALDHDERFGVWGGTSERERRRLKRTGVAA